jgi:hypothetical protein
VLCRLWWADYFSLESLNEHILLFLPGLKPDGLLLSVLKPKVSKEFKHRIRVAATAGQGPHKDHQKMTCNAKGMETRPTLLPAQRSSSPCCLNAFQTIFLDAIFMRPG